MYEKPMKNVCFCKVAGRKNLAKQSFGDRNSEVEVRNDAILRQIDCNEQKKALEEPKTFHYVAKKPKNGPSCPKTISQKGGILIWGAFGAARGAFGEALRALCLAYFCFKMAILQRENDLSRIVGWVAPLIN